MAYDASFDRHQIGTFGLIVIMHFESRFALLCVRVALGIIRSHPTTFPH